MTTYTLYSFNETNGLQKHTSVDTHEKAKKLLEDTSKELGKIYMEKYTKYINSCDDNTNAQIPLQAAVSDKICETQTELEDSLCACEYYSDGWAILNVK